MGRDKIKLLTTVGLLGFAVMYGMELSTKGIEQVRGPWEQPSPKQNITDEDWTLPQKQASEVKKTEQWNNTFNPTLVGSQRNREPFVDRFSKTTGRLLHDLAKHGIRSVVVLFENLFG